ncbi:MAG: glycoside hydrolase family 9 protein, partial [Vicinamibacterales bacterium]
VWIVVGAAALIAAATRVPTTRERIIGIARAVRDYPARSRRARTGAEAMPFTRLAASQVGYGPLMQKHFTSPKPFTSFTVIDQQNGAAAFRGGAPIRQVHTDVLGDINTVWIGDLSDLHAPGRYVVVADNGMSSYPFDIGTAVFDPAIRAVQRALYFQRAFTAIDAEHAEGPWTHGSDAGRAPAGVRQGWHDAGDFSIYNAQAASSLFWLLEAYNDFSPQADDTNIPESGNGVPDLLDEARWELEWMLSVQESVGGFRNTTCLEQYGPYGTNRHDDSTLADNRRAYVSGEVGTIPTARAVGTLAYAATVFRPFDQEFAERSLNAARRGWQYLEARRGENTDGPTCPASRQDGDAVAGRHVRAYAAAGMLLATGDSGFDRAFEENADSLANDPSTYRPNVYAALLYLRAAAGDPIRKGTIRDRLREQADAMRADSIGHPFEWSGRYFWGSVNAGFERAGGFAVRRCLADPRGAWADCDAAASNVHYALGRNLFHLSYINGLPGVTRSHAFAFHHWLASLNATPFLFPGMVAGGPNATPEPEDGSAPSARPRAVWGYWGDPAMPRDASTPMDGRYTDNDSWSTNEIDVVWQAAALYNLYFAQWLSNQGLSRTNTSTLSTTPADR